MPSATFFNLSEEKKKKLINAATHEFSIHILEEVSINQIIKNASIARGSFYMYFKDKNDLYKYLLKLHQEEINKKIEEEIIKTEGDFLKAFENMYDKIIEGVYFKNHASFFKNMFINFHFTIDHNTFFKEKPFLENKKNIFSNYVKTSNYQNIGEERLLEAFYFAFFIMSISIAHTFLNPENKQKEKEKFKNHISFLKYGIYKKED